MNTAPGKLANTVFKIHNIIEIKKHPPSENIIKQNICERTKIPGLIKKTLL